MATRETELGIRFSDNEISDLPAYLADAYLPMPPSSLRDHLRYSASMLLGGSITLSSLIGTWNVTEIIRQSICYSDGDTVKAVQVGASVTASLAVTHLLTGVIGRPIKNLR